LVRPLLTAAVVLRLALPEPDLGNEDDIVEVLEVRLVLRELLLAGIAGLDTARGLKDLLQPAAIGADHLLLAGGRTFKDESVPELALRERPIDHDEFTVEHFGVALGRALEQSAFADVPGAQAHEHTGERVVWYEFGEVARIGSL